MSDGTVQPVEAGSGVTRDPRPAHRTFALAIMALRDEGHTTLALELARVADRFEIALREIAEGVPCDRDHWSAAVAKQALEH